MINLGRKAANEDGETSIGQRINEIAFKVHGELGPGLDDDIYRECVEIELKAAKASFEKDVPFQIRYGRKTIKAAFHADFVIDRKAVLFVIAEPKSALHDMQIRSYLKHSGLEEAYIVNFRVADMREGMMRAVFTTDALRKAG